jgi:hypothetical protein
MDEIESEKAREVNFFQSTNEGRALVSKLRGIIMLPHL